MQWLGFEPGTSGVAGRRPSPGTTTAVKQELTTQLRGLPMPEIDNELLEGFRNYLLNKVSEDTLRDYVNAVVKQEWPPIKHSHVKAWRNYVQYLFSIGRLSWEEKARYLDFLKLPRSERKVEEEVPVPLIIKYKEIILGSELGDLYYLLLGGARLEHLVRMLESYAPEEVVKHPTGRFEPRLYCSRLYCRYYLGIRKGSKRVDYIYFPIISDSLMIPWMTYRQLRDYLNKRLGIRVKLFRKFVNQRLESLAEQYNIRLDAVNLIMSRELSVTGAHYLNVRDWADKLFKLYVEWLRRNKLI